MERHALASRDDGAEHAIAREERRVADVVGARRQLADAQVRAGVVEPEKNRGVEVERAAEQIERVVHREVNLFDARSREPVGTRLRGGVGTIHLPAVLTLRLLVRLTRSEEAVAARVLLQPHDLLLDARARARADPRHLRAEERQVQEREGGDERRVDRERATGRPRRA